MSKIISGKRFELFVSLKTRKDFKIVFEELNVDTIRVLIDRADRVLNLCEMKFFQDEFVISKDYDERLRRKISRLQEETGGKRNVQITLVTTFGLKKNMYSSRIQRVVTLDGLFK